MATLNFNQDQCILCGQCVEKCPFGALEILANKIEINASCKMCKLCVKSCPVQAVSLVEDAVKQTVDKDAWKGVMVFVEQEESGIHPVACELIGKARELAAKINHPVYAVLIGGDMMVCKGKGDLTGTVSLLEKHGITCLDMKGISHAASYPVSEYRKLGDLDLYINDKDAFHCAEQILHENGYLDEEELSDHHTTYRYTFEKTGRSFLLELHYRVVGVYQYKPANQLIDEVYSAENLKAESQEIYGSSYHVFPPTEYVFYMIHHMLKHYLYSGFGIRLLFDFSFYLEQHAQEVDFAKIHSWCQQSHILHLYESVLETCRIYLNLPEMIDPDVHYDLSDCDAFLSRILEDGDLGAEV